MVRRSPPARLRGVVLVLSITSLISSCLNDYDQFDATSAAAGAEMGGTPASSGAGGVTAAGGSDEAVAGGVGGASESLGGSTGQAGAGGAGGVELVCDAPAVACGTECVETSDNEEHCGGCGNSCTEQSAGFECSSAVCSCTSLEQCGSDSGERACEAGRCVCDGTSCAPGEICGRRGNQFTCRCNDGNACAMGMTCCETPRGCFDLQSNAANCGSCGRACAPDESCSLGQCG